LRIGHNHFLPHSVQFSFVNHAIVIIAQTAKIVLQILRKSLKRKLRKYLGKISLDLEEEKNLGCIGDAENDIRMNVGRR
jgi:2C-methyl-D-erythritol 2,4-cyclodiphosphate synthase